MGSGSRLALLVQHSFRRRMSTGTAAQQQEQEQEKLSGGAEYYGRFEADLAERAQQLQLQGGGGTAHLNWLLDACACTLSTHSSLASLLIHDPAAQSHLIHRADEVLSLLDVCTSLKQMADDADRQLGRLQRALQSAGQALRAPHISGAKVQAAAHRLSAACQLDPSTADASKQQCAINAAHALLLAAKRLDAVPSSQLINHALDGTLLISLLALASTLSSFTAPTRSGATRSTCRLVARYCSKSASSSSQAAPRWVGPLRQLQRDLRQEDMGALFLELQGLHASAASLDLAAITARAPVEVVKQGVDSLRKRSQEAQASMATLRSHLAALFQALLTLRLALLHSSS